MPIMNPTGETPQWKAFNVAAELRRAQRLARGLMDDAQLTQMIVFYVKPDGTADLTLGSSGYGIFMFRSPKRSKRGDTPVGVGMQCKVIVNMGPQFGVMVTPVEDHNCNDAILGPPRCSPPMIWERALAAGAPRNAVAQMTYMGQGGQRKWFLNVASYSGFFEDDCSTAK